MFPVFEVVRSLLRIICVFAVGSIAYAQDVMYRTDVPQGPAVISKDLSPVEVEAALRRVTHAMGVGLKGDLRLARIAAELGRYYAVSLENASIADVIEHYTRREGLVDAYPWTVAFKTSKGTFPRDIESTLRQSLSRKLFTHFGAAVTENGQQSVLVYVFSLRPLAMHPMAQSLAEPAKLVSLQGVVSRAYHDPSLFITLPSGKVDEVRLGKKTEFRHDFVPSSRGHYQIEILAVGQRGPTVIANFPIYVGVPVPPLKIADAIHEKTGTEVEHRLLALMNEGREKAGQKPLVRLDQLDGVARAHSEEMVRQHYVGHVSRETGDIQNRLGQAQINVDYMGENIAHAQNASGMYKGFMSSPSHRAMMLDPKVTHVGIGVVQDDLNKSIANSVRSIWYTGTLVFVRMAQAVDVIQTEADLVRAINAKRKERKLPTIANDPTLMRAAHTVAQAYFASDANDRSLPRLATDEARRLGARYQGLEGLFVRLSDPADVIQADEIVSKKARGMGAGVAYGQRKSESVPTVSVIVIFGR